MFFASVIYLELFIALFFLPGFFITVILGIKKFRFLLSFALSYSLLVLTLLPFEYYAQPIIRWQWCMLLEWVVLAVLAVIKMFMSSKTLNTQLPISNSGKGDLDSMLSTLGGSAGSGKVQYWTLKVAANIIRRLLSTRLMVPLVLAGVICGYLAYAGIYLEIPSDAWDHVLWFQWQKIIFIDNGVFPADPTFYSVFLNQGFRWHFIRAWLCQVSGLAIMDSLHVLTWVNVLVFLLAIYYFGLYLFAGLRISTLKKMMMAALASLIAGATMGNMVFAYIRYYAFAPTILNYVLFLTAMAVVVAWLKSDRWFGHALWIVPVLLIVTNVIHTQEALFIFFMTLALGLVVATRIFWRKIINRQTCRLWQHAETIKVLPTLAAGHPFTLKLRNESKGEELILIPSREGWGWVDFIREWKPVILVAALLVLFFAGFAIVRYFKPGAWISSNMIMPHVGIPLELVNFVFNKLLISPPHNPWLRLVVYQLFVFYQVIGLWGLFVYLLFVLMICHFVKIPYLMAGMIIVPFLTAFNPLTVDMMARLGQDVTIYRFHYLIPLPFIGAYLFVHFWNKARELFQKMCVIPVKSAFLIWPRLSWVNFVGCILIIAGLVGFIFPINAAGIYAPYSKVYTLRKIPTGNDYHLYNDLGRIMAKYENKVVLADPWTTRFLWCYSPKNTYHVPWVNLSNPEKEPPEPYTWKKLRNRGLIVINRRNGDLSVTGKIAKHWPEDILKVNQYYSPEVQNYLESHPEKFQKIWSQNRIAVYAVR